MWRVLIVEIIFTGREEEIWCCVALFVVVV